MVRWPCFRRARETCNIIASLQAAAVIRAYSGLQATSQIMAAVRQIEALVAEVEIRYLLVAQGQGQSAPVVERGVHDLVACKPAVSVGQGDVADFPAPAFHERDDAVVGFERARWLADRPVGKGAQLLAH